MQKQSLLIYTASPLPGFIKNSKLPWWKNTFPWYLLRTLRHRLFLYHRAMGHFAVTRSVLEGLKQNKIDFYYNPQFARRSTCALVLSCEEALDYAINLKEKGKINYLMAGPNISVLPSNGRGLLTHPLVDVCIVPSQWVKTAYIEDSPVLAGKIAIWAAGIDEKYWTPQGANKQMSRNILVYAKTKDAPLEMVLELLTKMDFIPHIVYYGNYRSDGYRQALSKCCCAVVLSRSESQGLALAEAWAMDVPTFCWDPQEFVYNKRHYSEVSSCPYLTSATGDRWKTNEELELLLQNVYNSHSSYEPRNWVLHNMTDEICAQRLWALLVSHQQ